MRARSCLSVSCSGLYCVVVFVTLCTAVYFERFIYSVFTKDTLDENGQARDTSAHVTFNALNSTKNSLIAAG